MSSGGSYKNLVVWQKSKELVLHVYKITDAFPQHEQFGLQSQIRRSAISIPSNIAEGKYRSSHKDLKHFLHMAFGSGAELETQLSIANDLGYISHGNYNACTSLLDEVMKMLNTMIAST